jgi:hypothetical protein
MEEDTKTRARGFSTDPSVSYDDESDSIYTGKADCRFPHQRAKGEIPDYVWLTPCSEDGKKDGMFLLAVEVKPDEEAEEAIHSALFQCYKQMLSKMFFQDYTFGLVITPKKFCTIFMKKDRKKIQARHLWHSLVTRSFDTEEQFNIPQFMKMVGFLSRVAHYATL